jgi:hypothetical protein
VSRRGRTGRDSRGWRGQSRRRRPETPDSHDSTAKTARTEPSEERNNLNDLLTQETEGSAATHRFDRDVLQDPPFRARLDGRLHIAVRETVHGMRESGVRAAPRFFCGPIRKSRTRSSCQVLSPRRERKLEKGGSRLWTSRGRRGTLTALHSCETLRFSNDKRQAGSERNTNLQSGTLTRRNSRRDTGSSSLTDTRGDASLQRFAGELGGSSFSEAAMSC